MNQEPSSTPWLRNGVNFAVHLCHDQILFIVVVQVSRGSCVCRQSILVLRLDFVGLAAIAAGHMHRCGQGDWVSMLWRGCFSISGFYSRVDRGACLFDHPFINSLHPQELSWT